jgi:hypothetical protein
MYVYYLGNDGGRVRKWQCTRTEYVEIRLPMDYIFIYEHRKYKKNPSRRTKTKCVNVLEILKDFRCKQLHSHVRVHQ